MFKSVKFFVVTFAALVLSVVICVYFAQAKTVGGYHDIDSPPITEPPITPVNGADYVSWDPDTGEEVVHPDYPDAIVYNTRPGERVRQGEDGDGLALIGCQRPTRDRQIMQVNQALIAQSKAVSKDIIDKLKDKYKGKDKIRDKNLARLIESIFLDWTSEDGVSNASQVNDSLGAVSGISYGCQQQPFTSFDSGEDLDKKITNSYNLFREANIDWNGYHGYASDPSDPKQGSPYAMVHHKKKQKEKERKIKELRDRLDSAQPSNDNDRRRSSVAI